MNKGTSDDQHLDTFLAIMWDTSRQKLNQRDQADDGKVGNLNFLLGESQVKYKQLLYSCNQGKLYMIFFFLIRIHWCTILLKTEIIRPFKQSYQSKMLCVSISKDKKDKKKKPNKCACNRQLKELMSKVLMCLSKYSAYIFQSQSCTVNCFVF